MKEIQFKDRAEAGRLLAREARRWNLGEVVVLGLGAGGLGVAAEVAGAVHAPLYPLSVTEIDATDPLRPSIYVGAVGSHGEVVVHHESVGHLSHATAIVNAALARARADQASAVANDGWAPGDLTGRVVILVDDGTSETSLIRAALDVTRSSSPERLLVGLPSAPQELVGELESLCDGVICGRVCAWLPWFSRHGRLYEEDTINQ